MTYRDKHALETLPGEISKLETSIEKLQAELGRADFYEKDPERFHQVSEKLGQLTGSLAEAEERWLELEMLKEELEG